MNASDLVAAVVHWLEYETLCNRARLFSEASLRSPVGEYLLSRREADLVTEEPYPMTLPLARGRPRSVDFCRKRHGGAEVWTEILEAKWITEKRDSPQEIFDDLMRLEAVERTTQSESFDRYLLVAGRITWMETRVFSRGVNPGGGLPRIRLFESVLTRTHSKRLSVPVAEAPAGVKEFWHEAARACGLNELPLSMSIALAGSCEPEGGRYGCWLWRITRSQNRKLRPVEKAEST
jgi:hypothetical protein